MQGKKKNIFLHGITCICQIFFIKKGRADCCTALSKGKNPNYITPWSIIASATLMKPATLAPLT